MLLVAMVLGMLLIRKVPEKWFRFLFLACILLNVIYRIEFLSPALAGEYAWCARSWNWFF